MDKRAWRRLLKERRSAVPRERRAAWAERMVEYFLTLPETRAVLDEAARAKRCGETGGAAAERWTDVSAGVSEPPRVLLYAAVGAEAPTRPLAEKLMAAGVEVCLPRLKKDRPGEMEIARVSDWGALVPGPFFGIPQPADDVPALAPERLSMVVVPGVGFDRAGRRLGNGGGYYDRFLPQLPERAARVGWAFLLQVVEQLPEEAHDCRVDIIVTEEGVLRPEGQKERSSWRNG